MKNLADYLNSLPEMKIDPTLSSPDAEIKCQICRDMGWVMPDLPLTDLRGNRLVPCPACELGQANLRLQWQRRLKSSELPEIYRKSSLSDWDKALDAHNSKGKILAYLTACEFVENNQTITSHSLAYRVQNFMGASSPAWVDKILSEENLTRIGFVFQGEVGTGKTWLASAVMNELVGQGIFVLYMRAQDIIQALTNTWNSDESEKGLLDRFKTVPVLFIDDMNLELRGKQLLPHQKDYMEAIIRYRSNHRLPSFITCNITLEQFYEQWGSRIADVVAADLQWVKVGGAKLRQEQQAHWGEL